MVTIIKRNFRVAKITDDGAGLTDMPIYDVLCLSTDEKPAGLPNGSKCLEMDTSNRYIFDEENSAWIELKGVYLAAEGLYF